MLEVLFGLAVVLAVVTLVGHGIWVVLALIFRAITGADRRDWPSYRVCPACGRSTSKWDARCGWCNADLNSPHWTEAADRAAFIRHARRLGEAGVLGDEEVAKLIEAAKSHQRPTAPPSQAPSTASQFEPSVSASIATPPVEPASIVPSSIVSPPVEPPSVVQPSIKRSLVEPSVGEPLPVAELVEPLDSSPASTGQPEGLPAEPRPTLAESPVPTQPPTRNWGQMLESFMEERNIRWGELIGGLLIVGGGIALAISLRDRLQAIPYSRFLAFALITAAVYGVGLYSHFRWKLATTSRGLLTIALLLAPISFLIMAALSVGDSRPLTLAVEAAGLAVFGCLAYVAARVLISDRPWPAVAGVMGCSVAVLVMAWLAEQKFGAMGIACSGMTPTGIFLGAVAAYLVRRTPRRWLDLDHAARLSTVLGVSAFAWIIAEGHFLAEAAKQIELTGVLNASAIPLAAAGIAPLFAGLVMLRRAVRDPAMEVCRMAGTAIALLGPTMLAVAMGLAWPRPEMLIVLGLFGAPVLAAAALRYRVALLHAGTIFCAAMVVLVGYHSCVEGFFGRVDADLGRDLIEKTAGAASGNLLGGLFVVSAIAAEGLVRMGRRRDGRVYAVGCGVLAVLGLSLVTWHGMEGGADALRAAILYAVYGLISVGLAARWNQRALSYLGMILVQSSMLWAAWWHASPPWPALLAFTTVATGAAAALRLASARANARLVRAHVERLIVEPCLHAALASGTVALAWLLADGPASAWSLAGHLAWLAALATILACLLGRAVMLGVAQGVWMAAAAAAARAWLEGTEWTWPDARILQAYGVALAGLGVVWNAARLVLRGNRRARRLLEPSWPSVDRLTHYLLVVIQAAVLVACLAPEIAAELTKGGIGTPADGLALALDVGPGAWLLLGLLTVASLARLWQRFEDADLAGLILIGAAALGLIAGRFADELAAASALRWTLAIGFLAASTLVWRRVALARTARRLGARLDLGDRAAMLVRGLLVATMALPVVGLTVLGVGLDLAGVAPGGPTADSWFGRIGPSWSCLVPLALIVFVLIGYALREHSAPHAFAAGAVLELAVALGYLLNTSDAGGVKWITLVQWLTVASAVWAACWLAARRWTDAWAAEPSDQTHTGWALMTLQLAEGVLGNAAILLPAVATVALYGPWLAQWSARSAGSWEWLGRAGGPLGWAALATVVAAIAARQLQANRAIWPDFFGVAGLAAVGLLSCTFFGFSAAWAFRCLLLGGAIHAALTASATWWVVASRGDRDGSMRSGEWILAAARWVRLAGIPTVLLGLWGSWHYDEQLWAAAAIAIASVSGAVMAVWLRREGWALAAAMGVNLAASLIVWHYRYDDHLLNWWTDLAWANIIASATVGLVWLAAAGRLYPKQTPAGERPLLTLQVGLPALGQTILCLLPVVSLATRPERLPEWIAALGCPVGWLALGLTVAAAGWRWLLVSRENVANIVVASVLGAATLATCHTGPLVAFGSYYFLVTSLAAVGFLIAAAGPLGGRLGLAPFGSRQAIAAWATAVGLLVIVLSLLHSADDPHRPWWFASTLLSVSVAAGLLAWWLRSAVYVFASGFVMNAVGMVVWHARGPETAASPIEVNVLCLGVGSVLWSAIGWLSRWGDKGDSAARLPMNVAAAGYTRLAAGAALLVSIVLAASRVAAGAAGIDHVFADTLSWISLGATAAALALLSGDRAAWWARPGLYLAGLSGVGLALDTRWLTGRQLAWIATIDLAAFALAAAVVGWIMSRRRPGEASEQETSTILPREMGLSSADWFSLLQQIVVVTTAFLAAWVSLDHAFDACVYSEPGLLVGRAVGPLAAVVLMAASWVMSGQGSQTSRTDWQLNTLLVTAAMLCCAGWWRLAADPATLWLHRAVVLMAGTALGTAVAAAIAVRSSSPEGRWFAASRRAAVALGAPAVASLALVMGLEVYFHQYDGTPMAAWAIATVAAALLGLMAGCICLAVVPGADPMNGDLRRRTIYVYAAELIGAVLGLHLWLTMPELFRLGIIEKYWPFLVMGVAFVGAGLSEWFQRLRLPVLAEPLERTALALPLVPALGFWFLPEGTPAFWFLASLFYGVMAVGRRSAWMGLAAVVTGNLGLWVLWDRWELNFLDRPQLWLIPAALCALVAEYAHHDRLKEAQSAAIRYMALSVIYVSSTVEFMRGVGESIWLPLVLIGLSLAGVLLGILLRVRSFVYLGVTFLLVVLVRMILYAAFEQGQMWVFWSACVCLGAMIIGLFAVLEKRRNDVLAALDKFRQWEK